jgi:putative FmdB family regulatory protein
MPLYEYKCRGCGRRFEALVRSGDTPACPSCHSADLERQLSVPAGMTTKELSKSRALAEKRRWEPVHKGREYEETQAAIKEHEDYRQDFAATKKHHEE